MADRWGYVVALPLCDYYNEEMWWRVFPPDEDAMQAIVMPPHIYEKFSKRFDELKSAKASRSLDDDERGLFAILSLIFSPDDAVTATDHPTEDNPT